MFRKHTWHAVKLDKDLNMDNLIQAGWFTEAHELWPGQSFSLEVEEVLYHEKSKFQDILIFQRLDYCIQTA